MKQQSTRQRTFNNAATRTNNTFSKHKKFKVGLVAWVDELKSEVISVVSYSITTSSKKPTN
jgi:hypothetical protein